MLDTTDTEVWKDIPGYEGVYQASSRGQVRSLPRTVQRSGPHSPQRRKGRVLALNRAGSGQYLWVKLSGKSFAVHRLIIITFRGPSREGRQTMHMDGDKYNNRIENLQWGTGSENCHHIAHHGRRKYTVEQVLAIRKARADGQTFAAIARRFRGYPISMLRICRKEEYSSVE